MPAARKSTDMFANIISQEITMSGANTLTFQEINVGLTVFDKVGLLLNRIEYHVSNTTLDDLTTSTDVISFGLTQSNQWSTVNASERSIIDIISLMRLDFGTAASGNMLVQPWVQNFSELPGGGMLVAPRPLYVYMSSTGLASAGNLTAKVFFTIHAMKPDEYFELLESRQFFG